MHDSHWRLWGAIGGLAVTLFGCSGGPGSPETTSGAWEPVGKTNERASSDEGTSTPVPSPNDNPTTGEEEDNGGSSDGACSGTYTCTTPGEDQTVSVSLSSRTGVCTANVGGAALVLDSDGTVKVGGEAKGTWSQSDSGSTFVISISDGSTVTCRK